jgi:uncharacterized membrane protein
MQLRCVINEKDYLLSEGVLWKDVRSALQDFLKRIYTDWKDDDFISYEALNKLLGGYIIDLVAEEENARAELMNKIQDEFQTAETLKPVDHEANELPLTYGQRLADKIADFGGSWTFIIIFVLIILGWIGVNVYFLSNKGFDPYPFILLNLVLSCLAALQAPVIMMSQNRQEDKDRERAEYDMKVNVKAEQEVRLLHEKIDYLLLHQHLHIAELYQLHTELMQQLQKRLDKNTII